MAAKDYYQILGVVKGVSSDEIKKAYRKLAMKWHPDRNPGNKAAEEKFKEIQEAYATLSDEKKRQLYDQLGAEGYSRAAQGGAGGAGGFSGFGDFSDLEDIFGQFFGGFGKSGGRERHSGSQRAVRGQDILAQVTISLEEAASGTTSNLKFNRLATCDACKGSGGKNCAKPTTCKTCNGSGTIYNRQGFFSIQQTCYACHGQGVIQEHPCTKCQGSGQMEVKKTISIKIPAGIDHGDKIRLSGEGHAGMNGGASGDLYVVVQLKPHKFFKRDGLDLHCQVPISFATAALGGEIEVPTLGGKVTLKIPTGLQSGKVLRLAKQGIKGMRGGQGDLYCTVLVETPVELNEEQQAVLRHFEELLHGDSKKHSPITKSWFENVKDFFAASSSDNKDKKNQK